MAELHDIIGSILRDLAHARAASDIYSRDLSRYYEMDPLLRKFPTPRAEIEEAEVTLKFLMSGIEADGAEQAEREMSLAPVLVQAAVTLSDRYMDAVVAVDPEKRVQDEARMMPARIDLRQEILVLFQREGMSWISGAEFSAARVSDIAKNALKKVLGTLRVKAGVSTTDLDREVEAAMARVDLGPFVKELKLRVEKAIRQGGDLKVRVEVEAAKLKEYGEATLSTIRIKSVLRNYVWSKMETSRGTWRELNPE